MTGTHVLENLVQSGLIDQKLPRRRSRAHKETKKIHLSNEGRYPAMEARSTLKRFERAASNFGGTGAA